MYIFYIVSFVIVAAVFPAILVHNCLHFKPVNINLLGMPKRSLKYTKSRDRRGYDICLYYQHLNYVEAQAERMKRKDEFDFRTMKSETQMLDLILKGNSEDDKVV